MIAPVLARIATDEADRLRVVSLDVDANPITTSTYRVMGMPTLALFVDGEVVVQFMGAKPRAAIMAQLEPHLLHAHARASVSRSPARTAARQCRSLTRARCRVHRCRVGGDR